MSAPNIELLGATYPTVSGVTLPVSGGGTATFPWVEGSETITSNGTVDCTTLSTVIVDVSGGGSTKNVQSCILRTEVNTTTYVTTDLKIIVKKAGTYKCSWSMDRNSTSGTFGTRLYVGATAKGETHTSFTHNGASCSEVLTLGSQDTLVVRGRSRSTSYYCGMSNLIIEEQ